MQTLTNRPVTEVFSSAVHEKFIHRCQFNFKIISSVQESLKVNEKQNLMFKCTLILTSLSFSLSPFWGTGGLMSHPRISGFLYGDFASISQKSS